MMGGSTDESWGFTIVETMIVLVMTGFILGSAIIMVNGRQNRTRFQVAIGQMQAQMYQIINEVSNGYYPNQNQLQCQAFTTGKPKITSGGTSQGGNHDCVFLGKVVQFGQGATTDQQLVFPVAGRRLIGGTGSQEVTKLSEAQPLAIANTGVPGDSQVDLSEATTMASGLTVADMWINNNKSQKANALAFYSSFAAYEADAVSLKSGGISLEMYNVGNLQVGTSGKNQAVSAVNNNSVTKIKQADICLASGTTNESGLLTIGNMSGGDLSVKLSIFSGTTC
ncbi:MAG: prepilin-type N-terminal cleavage/methylation protein [Candidatus Saccharibacteria bacterium]|nr:prepilin-type N-terminal cleavage/methylation protein [Candidatus Saccharibacteria bacterium]